MLVTHRLEQSLTAVLYRESEAVPSLPFTTTISSNDSSCTITMAEWAEVRRSPLLLALAVQEYDFSIEYQKGGNLDALSRRTDTVPLTVHIALTSLHSGLAIEGCQAGTAEECSDTEAEIHTGEMITLSTSKTRVEKTTTKKDSTILVSVYHSWWHVCRKYRPGPICEPIVVPILSTDRYIEKLSQFTIGRSQRNKKYARRHIARDVDTHCTQQKQIDACH